MDFYETVKSRRTIRIGYPSPKVKGSKQIKHKIKDKIHYNRW